MVFFIFFMAALVTVFAAVKLSTYADVISMKSTWGGMMVGTILLAGATSLPEVTTSLTAVVIDNPDIAIGNVLGSNLFNLFILAVFDVYYRKKMLFTKTHFSHIYSALLGICLVILVILSFILPLQWSLFRVGMESYLIILFYGIGIYMLNKTGGEQLNDEKEVFSDAAKSVSLKRAQIGFVIAAIITLLAGSTLAISGDQIALLTGIGSTFIGSFLIAASTSLPEAVAVLIALQLKNPNLAVGSILGSNAFNMLIISLSDAAYLQGVILQFVEESHVVSALSVCLLSVIVMISILLGQKNMLKRLYILPSIILIILYFVTSYIIFVGLP